MPGTRFKKYYTLIAKKQLSSLEFGRQFLEEFKKTSATVNLDSDEHIELLRDLLATDQSYFVKVAIRVQIAPIVNEIGAQYPARTADFLLAASSFWEEDKVLDLLTSKVDFTKCTMLFLAKLEKSKQEEILSKLIHLCIHKCQADMLYQLSLINNNYFSEVMNKFLKKIAIYLQEPRFY